MNGKGDKRRPHQDRLTNKHILIITIEYLKRKKRLSKKLVVVKDQNQLDMVIGNKKGDVLIFNYGIFR